MKNLTNRTKKLHEAKAILKKINDYKITKFYNSIMRQLYACKVHYLAPQYYATKREYKLVWGVTFKLLYLTVP
jgi:hypothetical protein